MELEIEYNPKYKVGDIVIYREYKDSEIHYSAAAIIKILGILDRATNAINIRYKVITRSVSYDKNLHVNTYIDEIRSVDQDDVVGVYSYDYISDIKKKAEFYKERND